VEIAVDESGNVASARAVSGHMLLRGASEEAARKAKFEPTTLCGRPVKVSGLITYGFVLR
jgi:protein TonB